MRKAIAMMSILVGLVTPAMAQFSVGIGLAGVSIGINVPVFPELARVPGYPVYYAPRLPSNYFFYDGMYWVYEGDNWHASSWYNGPWALVSPDVVPLYVLRIPVRYYRRPPPYFSGWRADAAPRWGEHWGSDWQQHRSGWDRWDHRSAPAPAPLPSYQRQFPGDRYPQLEQQRALHGQNYRYQPRDALVRQHYQEQVPYRAPEPPHAQQPPRPTPREAPRHKAEPEDRTRSPGQEKAGEERNERGRERKN